MAPLWHVSPWMAEPRQGMGFRRASAPAARGMPRGAAIALQGGWFDRHDRFFFIPLGANEALTEIWRHRVAALFLSKGLLNPDFARKLLSWRHSGFSIQSGTRIYDQEARQALSQYIVRPPLSLEKIHWDQDQDTVTWKSSRARGTWKDHPAPRARAPQHWYGRRAAEPPTPTDAPKDQHVSTRSSRKAWARLRAPPTQG